MKLPNFNPQVMDRVTQIFQGLQCLFIPVIMGVTAGSLVQSNTAHSSTRFMFAMTWLTIPMLIYVCMTPRFARTKPLANPYALCGLNAFYCFLWFIAFIALAAYNNSAISSGFDKIKNDATIPADKKPSSASCSTTLSGSPKECQLNKADVGLGVFMWLFLLITSLISGYIALYYRVHLCTPLEAAESREGQRVEETTKDAFDVSGGTGGDRYALINEDGRDPRWKGGHGRTPSGSGESFHGAAGTRQEGSEYSGYGGEGSDVGGGASQVGYDGQVYDEEYERNQARFGEGNRSRSVGSGSYSAGRVGFPDGDYQYTGGSGAAKR